MWNLSGSLQVGKRLIAVLRRVDAPTAAVSDLEQDLRDTGNGTLVFEVRTLTHRGRALRGRQCVDFTRAAADSGMGSYRTKERVNEAAPCKSERKSMA